MTVIKNTFSDPARDYVDKIKHGTPIVGVGTCVSYAKSIALDVRAGGWGPITHIKDAFTVRRYLVKLNFAHETFVVSIKNTEAPTFEEALSLAVRRALFSHMEAEIPLGNLVSFDIDEDTLKNRERFHVEAAADRSAERAREWADAA